ncbi:hypothetical protein ACHAWF_004903 [Thalassiosira exigua]
MTNWDPRDEDAIDDDAPKEEDADGGGQRRRRRGRRRSEDAPGDARRDGRSGASCESSERDYRDAAAVARRLSVPLRRASFASEYWTKVFQPFVERLSSSRARDEEGDGVEGRGGAGGAADSRHEAKTGAMATPNPDFGCNVHVKFGAMREHAFDELEGDYVATGHYARLWHREHATASSAGGGAFRERLREASEALERTVREAVAGRPEEEWIFGAGERSTMASSPPPPPMLLAAADRSKDQSYFLSGVPSEAFRRVLFPLGHLTKRSTGERPGGGREKSVRDIAREAGLPTAEKRDSAGLCFVGRRRDFGTFVSQYLPRQSIPGDFVDVDAGTIVGRHAGSARYTIGQGARISGAPRKYYVCGAGRDGTTVYVCDDADHPALRSEELTADAGSFNWIGLDGDGIGAPRPFVEGRTVRLLARMRHMQPLVPCEVRLRGEDNTGGREGSLVVRFDEPVRAITPGQIVALYAGRGGLICLGGGPIEGRGPVRR